MTDAHGDMTSLSLTTVPQTSPKRSGLSWRTYDGGSLG